VFEAGARLALAGSASPPVGAVPSLMAAVSAALVELLLQPTKLTARNADALMRPNVRTSERIVMVVQTPVRRKSFGRGRTCR